MTSKSTSLTLTPEQVAFVHELRARCKAENVQLRNDLEAVRMGIVTEANVDDAMKRLVNVRAAEAQYRLEELSLSEAFGVVEATCPGFFYGVVGVDKQGRGVVAVDKSKILPKELLKDEHKLRCFFKVMSTTMQASAASIEELDRGIIIMAQARGLNPLRNFSHKFDSQMAWMHQDGFPVRVKQVIVLNANIVVRNLFKVIKRLLRSKMQERLQLRSGEDVCDIVHPDVIPFGIMPAAKVLANLEARAAAFRAFETSFKLEHVTVSNGVQQQQQPPQSVPMTIESAQPQARVAV